MGPIGFKKEGKGARSGIAGHKRIDTLLFKGRDTYCTCSETFGHMMYVEIR